jgi:hypothetical protein
MVARSPQILQLIKVVVELFIGRAAEYRPRMPDVPNEFAWGTTLIHLIR